MQRALKTVAYHPFDSVTLDELRARRSAKWSLFSKEVLPVGPAEMDFPLAEPIRRVLHDAIERGDSGYATLGDLGEAFAARARALWSWTVLPIDVHLVSDVVTGIAELLRIATKPGEPVLIDPPVYAAFASVIQSLGRVVVHAPLSCGASGWALNLGAIADAYASGVRVHLLCSPQNPTGIVHPAQTLAELAELAERYGVLVLSDEVHAPLTLPGAVHVPFPCVSPAAAARTIVLTSASKAWNVPGLKAAMLIPCGDHPRAILAKLPAGTPYHAGHFGVLAGWAALSQGEPWRAQTIAILDRNRKVLHDLLQEHLPEVVYRPPQASYLAWLDFRALKLGDDPARLLFDRGRIALTPGHLFGAGGADFARLNIGTTLAVLEESVRRMCKGVRGY